MIQTNCKLNYTPKQVFIDACQQIRTAIGRVFSTLAAIKEDGNATIQLLKVGRYALLTFRAFHGKTPSSSSILDHDWETTINLLEGWQFVAAISSLLPAKKKDGDDKDKAPLLERITNTAFAVSDCFSGALWMLSKGIPLLGVYSESMKVLKSFDIVTLAAALIGSVTDGASAAQIISKHWEVTIPDKTIAFWQLCERISGVASLILILSGPVGTLAYVATGFAATSAVCGLVRFAYKWNLPEKTETT